MRASRHPCERERLQALRAFAILDTGPEALFDELVAIAAETLEVPIALVSLVDERRQWFKARLGFEPCQTTLEESFCAHVILEEKTLVVEDATADARFADNPLVDALASTGQAVRFYAGAPLLTAEGLPLGTLCVLDYRPRRFGARERRRLELLRDQAMALLERHRLRLEAERQSRLKSEFLAHVSHEIRTPLAAVLGYAELLGTTLEKADDRAAVETIMRNGDHLRAIVDELLDISRIEAGQLDIRRAPCALEPLLGDLLCLMRVRARQKGLGWHIRCREALPVAIVTDALRLRQILLNLVGNAMKFTERGEVVLELAVRDAGGTIEFAVHDTGIGMSAVQLARVFEPYHQAGPDGEMRAGGTGLGLSISRELARLLGGEIVAESREGVGSAFRLRLPCEPATAERRVPTPHEPAPAPPRRRIAGALAGRRLLVVDDREDIRTLAERTLVAAGADVLAVDDGERALERLRRERRRDGDSGFDALVLDMQMPGADGFDVLEALRADGVELPVVALTADALLGQRERCIAAGCRAYLSKPFTTEALVDVVAGLFVADGPSAPPAPDADRDASDVAEPSGDGASAAARRRVLIVDDSADLARALARTLAKAGFAVDVAHGGSEALALAERAPPECVVLDRSLPDIDSRELVEALRAREALATTRYISLTGTAIGESERRALGFDRYLRKPVPMRTLLEVVEEVLG